MRTSLALLAWLSSAVAAAAEPSASPAQLAQAVDGKGAKVASSKSTLESPDFMDLNIKKGYCYTVEVKLNEGSSWKAGRSADMLFVDWTTNRMHVGPRVIGKTGATFEPGCAENNGKARMGLETYGPNDHVGSGGYLMQVYERQGSAGELQKEARVSQKAHSDSIRSRDASRKQTCQLCASESAAVSSRRICLERRGVKMADCGW